MEYVIRFYHVAKSDFLFDEKSREADPMRPFRKSSLYLFVAFFFFMPLASRYGPNTYHLISRPSIE